MKGIVFFIFLMLGVHVHATDLKIGEAAPLFKLVTHEGVDFSLESRLGKWTVLYFYPKANTPGCTKQACGFRDSIEKIRALNAEVFGVSTDDVKSQAAFHKEHKLNFVLLADDQGKVTQSYGASMPLVKIAKRWTFIIDDRLKIRAIDKDVDPVLDAKKVAEKIKQFQSEQK